MKTRRHARIAGVRASRTAATLCVLAGLALTAQGANAASPEGATPEAAAEVEARLGSSKTAGTFYDVAARNMVVNVTDSAAAQAVRAAGAQPRFVKHSSAELAEARRALDVSGGVPGTAWGIDVKQNKLILTLDSTVRGVGLATLQRTADPLGDRVTMVRVAGRFRPLLSGGDPAWASDRRCTAGFNVRQGDSYAFLTAGHCTQGTSQWYADAERATHVGPAMGSSFPGNDYGIVRYDNGGVPRPGAVGTVDVTGAGDAYVGQRVCHRGSTSGVSCGQVTGTDQTVNYGSGRVVSGLIRTRLCARPGDSGGPLFAGETAVGLISGGSGDCSSGGPTFYNPVAEALDAYGASVY
ncbi:S1 family peptidase [Streptomyces sp. KR80]|uniref:S1 family peptidase n=1 Tax=Streptomyces sp. KR80 TaxID=3457426 RepID=UPI003FD10038